MYNYVKLVNNNNWSKNVVYIFDRYAPDNTKNFNFSRFESKRSWRKHLYWRCLNLTLSLSSLSKVRGHKLFRTLIAVYLLLTYRHSSDLIKIDIRLSFWTGPQWSVFISKAAKSVATHSCGYKICKRQLSLSRQIWAKSARACQ